MNPLTRTFVRHHRLDAEVFRQAARLYAERFSDPDCCPGGCCHVLRESCWAVVARQPYRHFFFTLLDDPASNRLLYMWPCPPPPGDSRRRDVSTMLTPRLIALELCALIVEDLSK